MALVSAPGKVYLIGEHAVVYGKPAIIAAVGLRTKVDIEDNNDIIYIDKAWPDIKHVWPIEKVYKITEKTATLWRRCSKKSDFKELFNFVKMNNYENYRASVLGIAMKELEIDSGFKLIIDSAIPLGSGLGSSSSRAVAITYALARYFGKEAPLDRINEIAYEQEKIIHGTPSGGDNSACCYGGLIWFKKSQPKNEIKSLREEIPYELENFILVNSGIPEKTTGELVQMVRNLDEKIRNPRIEQIGKMTYEMRDVLKKKDFDRMIEIINLTQKNLSELGLSTANIDKIYSTVKEAGGAAKLCGAGGGGIVLCYHKNRLKLKKLITDIGFQPIETELGVEGVRRE